MKNTKYFCGLGSALIVFGALVPGSRRVLLAQEHHHNTRPDAPAGVTNVAPEVERAVTVNINATARHQKMEGFGATTLALVTGSFNYADYDNADNLTPTLRARALKAIYGEVGINMGNLNLPLLEERGNDDDDPFHLNPDGFDWRELRFMKENVVDLGRPYGFDNYSLSNNIDLRRMGWLKPLREADYPRYLDECAEHVLAGVKGWNDLTGSVPPTLMLFNEPLSGNRELQGGTTQEVVDIVKRSGARLQAAGFAVKFVVPNEETEAKSLETATAILADPQARPYVAAIGYHPYPYGSPYASIPRILQTSGQGQPDAGRIEARRKLKELAARYGVELWMTEVSHGEAPLESMDALRGRAIHIHDELEYADVAAYFGMNALWDSVTNQEHTRGSRPLSFETDTVALADDEADTVTLTGMGYAIGHYARWIKRGAVRVEAQTNDPLVLVSAFRDDARRQFSLVLINNAAGARRVSVSVKGLSLRGPLRGEQSSATVRWQPLPPNVSAPSEIELILPPQCVTSVGNGF